MLYGIPTRQSSMPALEAEFDAALAELAEGGPSELELQRIKKVCRRCRAGRAWRRARWCSPDASSLAHPCPPAPPPPTPPASRAQLLDALSGHSSMAAALASYQALTGDWRGVVDDLERIESLTPGGVRDVAARYLVPSNSFRAYVLPLNVGAFVGAPTP